MKDNSPFSQPSHWCDTYCERCPLAWECESTEPDHLASLQASPKPSIVAADDIVRARIAPRPPADDAVDQRDARARWINPVRGSRLRHTANALYATVDEVTRDLVVGRTCALSDEIHACLVGLVATCWRIAGAAEQPLSVHRWRALEPLLLLASELDLRLNGLMERAGPYLEPARRSWADELHQLLGGVLRPMVAQVSHLARDYMTMLIDDGVAPSPFCKVWPDWYHRLDGGSEAAVDRDHLAV